MNLVKPCIEAFPEAFKERAYYTIRKNERELGLVALKSVSNEELTTLERALDFELKNMFSATQIECLFKHVSEAEPTKPTLPRPAYGAQLTPDERMIQRMRRQYKRENRIL